jgi:hypothetical protein
MTKRGISLAVLCLCLTFAASPVCASLMQSYNLDDAWIDGGSPGWAAQQVALKYVPTFSYALTGVEFFTAGEKSGVTVALRADVGGKPSSAILTSGTYDNHGAFIPAIPAGQPGGPRAPSGAYWQGATFSSPYLVVPGTTYWVTWYNTKDLAVPRSTILTGGTQTVLWASSGFYDPNNPAYYSGVTTAYGFKTKFYGEVPEPATVIVWSLLAGLGITVGWWWRRRKAA